MPQMHACVRPLLTLAATIAVGCSQPPVSPTVASTHGSTLSGRVLDGDGEPVAGARITVFGHDDITETQSDADGRYRVFDLPIGYGAAGVDVDKDGFERSLLSIVLGTASGQERDLRLHRILRITANESAEVRIRSDDPICIDPSEFEYPCRRVRVVSTSPGRLFVSPVDTFDPVAATSVVLASPGHPDGTSGGTLSFDVVAGTETVVDVRLVRGAGASIFLQTDLRAR